MSLDTDTLIDRLTAAPVPVRPLPSPAMRTLALLTFGTVVVFAATAWLHGISQNAFNRAMGDWRFWAELAATFVTALSATLAAFETVVPGRRPRWLWLPFASLATWLLLTGAGCITDYQRFGDSALTLRLDTACFVPGAVAGAILAVVLIFMLRRGAPMVPRLTLMLAGIAVAAIVNAGLLLLHEGDVSVMLLVWHTGFVVALGVIGSVIGPLVLRWRHRGIA